MVFLLVLDPNYGVIWNPEKISYALDPNFFSLCGKNLTKIQNTINWSSKLYFLHFRADFSHFTVVILVLNLNYEDDLDFWENFLYVRH